MNREIHSKNGNPPVPQSAYGNPPVPQTAFEVEDKIQILTDYCEILEELLSSANEVGTKLLDCIKKLVEEIETQQNKFAKQAIEMKEE